MMAYWAEVDENNIVLRVLVGSNDEPDEGHQWLNDNLGGTWVKTSFNTHGGVHYGADGKPDDGIPFRKNYASVGMTYDKGRDAFMLPKPFASWVLNEDSCIWKAPTPRPIDGEYLWDEPTLSWKEVE